MADPTPGTPSQRTLAAIVFTDAVSFSARMQKDETGTLRILQRDFGEMRRICATHEGSVLKTTGDGLLMTFASAVHAVACALAMQRQFASETKDQSASKFLKHRIGIHIGDIIVQDQDVMGDGVNIASRLQSEAEPGGICISQTVYDVVKNKIALRAVSLGPRDLKNITQAIPVYRLLLEAQALQPGTSNPPMPAKAAAPKSSNRLLLFGSIAAGLAVVFAAGMYVNRQGGTPKGEASSPAAPAAATATTPASAAVALVPRSPEEEALELEFAKRKEMLQARLQFLDKYDFDGFARSLRDDADKTPVVGKAAQQAMLRSVETMGALKDWMTVSLRRFTRQRPMPVRDLSGDRAKNTAVFVGADKQLVFVENGGVRAVDLPDIKPPAMASIIASAVQEIKQGQSRDVILGAQAFSRIYNIPALMDALPKPVGARQGGGQAQNPGQGRNSGPTGARGRVGGGDVVPKP